MVLPGTGAQIGRRLVLCVSYAALIAIAIFAWATWHVNAGVMAIIPLIFIAYYGRTRIAILTAASFAALLALVDYGALPRGNLFKISPQADAIMLGSALCVVVFMVARLREGVLQNSALLANLERVRTQAERDSLTGVPNRSYFLQRLRACIRNMTAREHIGVLFADLDGFKAVNDHAGHIAGDSVLVLAAERLRRAIRADDVLARIGGDEFAILIDHLSDRSEADALCLKIESLFEHPFSVDHAEFNVGVTLGVSIAPQDGMDPHSLLETADARMYRRKEAKRGRAETIA
jgi:diguanylate cyclase (GGDEF)-like protein